MPDTVYRVVTQYVTDSETAEKSVESLASKHQWLSSSIASSAGMLTGMFDRVASSVMHIGAALVTGGVGAALAGLVHGVTALNAGAEEAQIAIAGMMQAGGATRDFPAAMRVSNSLIQQMRVHARELPGEFQDLMNVFQGGLMGGLGAGKSSQQIERLSAQWMSVTQAQHIDSATAGREFGMLLEGRAGSHVAMWARIHTLIGKSSQEFNAMSQSARFEAIERAMHGFDDSIRQYGHSWSAISSTAHDHLTDMLRIGTAPLFEHAKNALQRLNKLFEANEPRIMEMVRLVGDRLAGAFDRVVGGAYRLVDVVRHLNLHSVLGHAEHGIGSALAARAGLGLLSSQSVMTGVGGMVGGGALAGAGMIAAVALPVAAALASGQVDTTRVLARLSSAVAPLAPVFRQLWTAAQPLLVLVGSTLIEAFTTLVQLIAPLISAVAQFTTGFLNILTSIGSALSGWLGQHGLSAGERGRGETVAERRAREREHTGFAWTSVGSDLDDMLGFHRARGLVGSDRNLFRGMHGPINLTMPMFPPTPPPTGQSDEQRIAAAAAHQTPHGHMTVHLRIEQTINDASDPDRVTIETRRAVLEALRHPVESHSVVVLR